MPELHAQTCGAAITAEQRRHASSTGAALGVNAAPELGHGLQRLGQHLIESLGATGMANGPLQAGSQAVAIGAVGRPALGFVLVVERSELGDQLALAWRVLGLWLDLDRFRFIRLRFSWFRFSRLQFSWSYPDSVDRYQGFTGESLRVLMNCCS